MTAKMTTVKVPAYEEMLVPDSEVTTVHVPPGGPAIGRYSENDDAWFNAFRDDPDEPEFIGKYPTELQAAQSIAFTTVIRSKAEIDRARTAAADEAIAAEEAVKEAAATSWDSARECREYRTAWARLEVAQGRIRALLTEETERWCAFQPDEFDSDGEYSQYLEDISVDHPERAL